MPLLEVKNLKVHFPVKHGLFSRVHAHVKAVDDVSFAIESGETLGLVGESGCGKTTLGRAIVKLVEPTSGSIFFEGKDIAKMSGTELRLIRRGNVPARWLLMSCSLLGFCVMVANSIRRSRRDCGGGGSCTVQASVD